MVFGEHVVRLFQRDDQPSNYWFMRVTVESKQYRRSLKTCVLGEAKKVVSAHMVKILAKQMVGQRVFSTSLKDWREGYLIDVGRTVDRGERSKLTLNNISQRMDYAFAFLRSKGVLGSSAVDSVEGGLWQDYIDYRLEHKKTMRRDVINSELVTIKAAFEWARKQGWCSDRNVPKWELVLEKQQAMRDKLTNKQFRHVITLLKQYQDDFLLTVVMTMSEGGFRTGEVLKLRRRDVEIGKNELVVTVQETTSKVRKSRQVPIRGSWLKAWIEARELKPDDPVFPTSKTFYRTFKKFREKKLVPNGLGHADCYHARHAWITERLEAGESIHLVARLAGTSTIQIERTYSGVVNLIIGREFAKKKIWVNDDGSTEVLGT